ncbi:regulator of G-protein signaling 5-like [Nerophis ophidion]|uniref:regulator of G-protein signaling 5-like n=1 Tax=Nerophis ophidion TaxID=159077 RepID=UPI002AE058CD|nr:regulator of G-protein signaling 5-like [Nerophis ophidion]
MSAEGRPIKKATSPHTGITGAAESTTPRLTMCRGLDLLPITCLERAKELKALFGSLLQKSEQVQPRRSQQSPSFQVDERLQWKESFDKMLHSPNGLCLFRAFLVSEFSEENIAFYLACEDYKAAKPSKMAAKARRIYEEFISTDAPREVNLDHVTKALIRENVERPARTCFDLAQARIYTLMEKDCYPRFLKSLAQQTGPECRTRPASGRQN